MMQNEQLLRAIETGMNQTSELALRLHGDQIQSIAQLERGIRSVTTDIETQSAEAEIKEQRKYLPLVLQDATTANRLNSQASHPSSFLALEYRLSVELPRCAAT
jgi:hypothetical protein